MKTEAEYKEMLAGILQTAKLLNAPVGMTLNAVWDWHTAHHPPMTEEQMEQEAREYATEQVGESYEYREQWKGLVRGYIAALRRHAPQPAAPVEDGWISVKDKLPEPGEKVLCYFYPKTPQMQGRLKEILFRIDHKPAVNFKLDPNGFVGCSEVTHWMRLPDPPTNNIS